VPNNLEQAYELTLVVRSQIGDESAFEELLKKYSPRLRFYVTRMLRDQHSHAEDLLQEIWITAFRTLPRLRDAMAFHAWLFSIARARVCREFRRARVDFDSLVDESHGEATKMDAGIDSDFDLEAVHQQLAQLSAEHREALLLRFIEEMSYDEIARVTGRSVGTVRSRIHYAKNALRRAWKQNTYETE
jgi:RNA polymerase sigma-70 factor, ECF subfamily